MARSAIKLLVLLALCAWVCPMNRYANERGKVGSIMCSLTQSIHFLSYLVSQNQLFQYPLLISTAKTVRRNTNCVNKIETRGKSERKYSQAEKIIIIRNY
jgi:hypothetical protein